MPHRSISQDIVIGIPTFRRPKSLHALLQSLLPELQRRPAYVVVADNDCGSEASRVVDDFSRHWPHVACIPVKPRGVAQVRNALVLQAGVVAPQWRWLLMLDDDGLVTPGWLDRLLGTGLQLNAHLAGGPVIGVLPEGAGILARNSIFATRRRWPTGLVPTLNTTQNLAIARKTLELVAEPLFRNEYGASGGEDYDLFRRVADAGGRIAWCDDAIVMEPAPPERLTVRSLLARYATTGAYMVRIDRSYDGVGAAWWQAIKGLSASVLRLGAAALTLKGDKLARAVLAIAHYLGRLAGLIGMKFVRYVSPKGKG